jgi:glucosamine--fructose-6-phosphate aminotransferase (isomerizing)
MCGIVGAIAERNVVPILVEGLRRLEYRGYDSAGVAVLGSDQSIGLCKTVGKVAQLEDKLRSNPLRGRLGVAHTRWATHGGVTEANAHPHMSGDRVAVIHNGIIENYQEIKDELEAKGYEFVSETDTEVAAHLVYDHLQQGRNLVEAVQEAVACFTGAFALLVVDAQDPDRFVVSRVASPLVIGLGIGENFVASGVPALLPVTQRFIYLEQGDIAEITRGEVNIFGADGKTVEREVHETQWSTDSAEKGPYRHFMLKEIFEQPSALANTLYGRIEGGKVVADSLGPQARQMLSKVEHIHIVACGTSYHAGCVAKYWIESLAGVTCQVEIASEYRYREVVVPLNTLFLTLSQSGETADTLEALRIAKQSGYIGSLTVCNSAHSSMVRESDLSMMTQAGPEIGVASTKAFTTQLLSMLIVTLMLARERGMDADDESKLVSQIAHAAAAVDDALQMNEELKQHAEDFAEKEHTLFLGRGPMWPVAMEGALKLKEISYIHAEATS